MTDILAISGEGGGQVLRTALALSVITGRAIRVHDIRAGRPEPGMAARHLTAVRAAATLCRAEVAGDSPGSLSLDFAPRAPAVAGDHVFDADAAGEEGSTVPVTPVLQTVLPPLALAAGESGVTIHGGTHVTGSPPYDYVEQVWLPAIERLGIMAHAALSAWGWHPAGGGEIRVTVAGGQAPQPLAITGPGPLLCVSGRAVAANLPSHIPQRMTDRARALLTGLGCPLRITPQRVRAASPGAGIFLTAEYENIRCGFGALGALGISSEQVAEQAAAALLQHHGSGAALDRHLADQVLVPLALADGPSVFTVAEVTRPLAASARVIEQLGLARVAIARDAAGRGTVTVEPAGRAP